MIDRTESRPTPAWFQKIMAAKAAALEALTPDELEKAAAEKAARRQRVEARRLAAVERTGAIFAMFADGHSDIEIGRALNRTSRSIRRFAELRGFTMTRSEESVSRCVKIARPGENALRRLAAANGLTPVAAIEQLVGLLLGEEAEIGRRMLRNPELAREAIAAAFRATAKPAA